MPRKPRKYLGRIKARLKRELESVPGIDARGRVYEQLGLLKDKRMSALVYSVERHGGMGTRRAFALLARNRKARKELEQLVREKHSGSAFIGVLGIVGAKRLERALLPGTGGKLGQLMSRVDAVNLATAIQWGNPENFGELLQRTNASKLGELGKAIVGAKGAGFGDALDIVGAGKMSIALKNTVEKSLARI